jgi:maltose/maltodextrin transport system substrate-binding protein/arabinogalactan oligomer/maltooligosaccharide transport system substrate-binding protein
MEEPTEVVTEAPVATEAPTEAPPEPTATEVATEAVVEPEATLRIWADDTRTPILNELADDFLRDYNVELVVEDLGRVQDIRSQVIIAIPAGEGPDIFIGVHDWLGSLVESGLVAPVDLGDRRDEFVESNLEAFTYTDGNLYGLPYASENLGFFYNTELVPEPPTTWAEVLEIGRALKAEGKVQAAFAVPTGPGYNALPIQTAFGGYVFGENPDGSYNAKDIGLNSEGTVAAFDWLNNMYEQGLLDRGSNIDAGLLLSAFQNGDAAMLLSGPWALSGFREAGVPYAVAPVPAGTQPGQPFMGVQGFMINAFSKNQLLAQTFLQEFVATDATMQAFYEQDPRVSAWLPVSATIEDPDLKAFAAAGATADPMPNIPEMNAVWKAWGDAMTLISNGDVAPQEAMDQAQTQVEAAIAGQ